VRLRGENNTSLNLVKLMGLGASYVVMEKGYPEQSTITLSFVVVGSSTTIYYVNASTFAHSDFEVMRSSILDTWVLLSITHL
jgi:hypothetical protein